MKSSIRTMFVVLAIVMSFVAVQGVCAGGDLDCTTVVEGTVTGILHDVNAVVVGDYTVYGIPVDEWDLDIKVNDSVVINAHECSNPDDPDDPKLVACDLTVTDQITFDLRPSRSFGKP